MGTLVIVVFIALFVIIAVVPVVAMIAKTRKVVQEIKIAAETGYPTSFSAALSPVESDSSNLGQILQSLPSRFDPSVAGSMNAVLQLHCTDHQPADWHLDVADGACRLAQGQSPSATTTATASARVWADILSGRTSYDSAFMAGTIEVSGDPTPLMRLSQLFPDAGQRAITGSPMPENVSPTPVVQDTEVVRMTIGAALGGEISKVLQDVPRDLPPEERKRAIVEALKREIGDAEYERWGTLFGSGGKPPEVIREAIRSALAALPANASHVDKLKAVQAALQG